MIPSSGFLREWCDDLGKVGEAAPEAHLSTGIAVLSAIGAPKLRVTIGKSEEFAHVWQLVVGQSALGAKTTTLQSARAAIDRARMYAGEGELRFDYLTRATDAGIVELLGAQNEEDAERWTERWPRSWLLAWNEVSTLFTKDAARWEESSRRVLLSVYDGYVGSHTKATKAHATRVSVTMIGNIPPHVLHGAASELMFSSGFAGRWLVMPTPPLVRSVPFPAPASQTGWDQIESIIDDLGQVVRRTLEPVQVSSLWTPEAAMLYTDWYDRLFKIHNSASDEGAHRAAEVWARARTTAVKLSALSALGRQASQITRLDDLRIEEADAQWAMDLIDRSCAYWAPMIEDSRDQADPDVEQLLRFASRAGATCQEQGVTLREFMLATKSGGRVRVTAERAKRAVRAAAEAGLLDFAEDGRRSIRYWVLEDAA